MTGPKGAVSVSAGGKLLGSAYDPRAEGERLAGQMLKDRTDVLVAIGFGLGHQLEAFRERHGCPVIVYEPSPARLRAALSTRPIPLLDLDDVWITTELPMLGSLLSRYYTPGLCVRIAPHPSAVALDPESVREAVHQVQQTKNALDITATTRVRMAGAWSALTVENLPHLIENPNALSMKGTFEGLPAVVCAAGPSLDKQLPLLREYQDRVLVVAIGQVVGSLRRAGITPHIVHLVESQDVRHHLADEDGTGAEDLNLFLLPSAHPGLFELPVRSRFHVPILANTVGVWLSRLAGDPRGMHSGGTVAQTAVFLASALGANPVLLIGQDLAYTGNRAYARDSVYDGVGFEDRGDGRYELTRIDRKMRHFREVKQSGGRSRRRDLVWVPAWGGGKVPTSPAYASFRESYRDIAGSLARSGGQLVNCTEGGALIPNVDHVPFAEMLERHAAPGPTAIAERIHRVYDTREKPERAPFERGIAELEGSLEKLEREAARGLDASEKAVTGLRMAQSPQRKIDLLRGIGRYERRVQQGLGAVPWLDPLVQLALHEAMAGVRKSENQEPTPEAAAEESRMLFETTLSGIERARALLERVAERLDESLPEPLDRRDP
ncbi:MAG: DUF115 domain-containing protein [Myxococcales bacterium]|nr:DUF115 domain-containing protein [Myxococcales bacterium]